MSEKTVDCAVECINGCILGDDCPHQEYKNAATQFISDKSIDDLIKIADDSLVERLTKAPKFELPDIPQWPES